MRGVQSLRTSIEDVDEMVPRVFNLIEILGFFCRLGLQI